MILLGKTDLYRSDPAYLKSGWTSAGLFFVQFAVLGFFGLVGADRTELFRTILGIDPKVSGEVWFEGKKLDIRTLKDSIDAGIALIPEERR